MTRVVAGCCGWGFFSPKKFFGPGWKREYASAVQAYAALFPLNEVNSTFCRLPKKETAQRWLSQAREKNPEFEFGVKAFRGITHDLGFAGDSLKQFMRVKQVCSALEAKTLLFQTPASFAPTEENVSRMRAFFPKAPRGRLAFAWEPRGKWLAEPEKTRAACEEFGLVECVDPLRGAPASRDAGLAYFRLHGFGKPLMYNYRFSDAELSRALKAAMDSGAERACVLFNNYHMFGDALRFARLAARKTRNGGMHAGRA
jgi:uncharacterized protein YecE (DUF72 family)